MDSREVKTYSCILQFILKDADNQKIGVGRGRADITALTLTLVPETTPPYIFPLKDIWGITPQTYRLWLQMAGGLSIMLFDLGQAFENFVRSLTQRWNHLLLEDLFPGEQARSLGIHSEIEWEDDTGIPIWNRTGELRIYKSNLVLMPDNHEIQKIPFGCIEGIKVISDQKLELLLDSAVQLRLSRFEFEDEYVSFRSLLFSQWNQVGEETRDFLYKIFPLADHSVLQQLSELIKGGKAAVREKIEEISPPFWKNLEKKLLETGLADPYSFISRFSDEKKRAIGCRRIYHGDTTKDLFWFLLPVFGIGSKDYGNIAALGIECNSHETKEKPGKKSRSNKGSTKQMLYFFRLVGRERFRKFTKELELSSIFAYFLRDLNHALLAIDFSCEPFFLSEKNLGEPPNRQFYYSLRVMPEVRLLRSHYIGRIQVSSEKPWRDEIRDIFHFNITSTGDEIKWKES